MRPLVTLTDRNVLLDEFVPGVGRRGPLIAQDRQGRLICAAPGGKAE